MNILTVPTPREPQIIRNTDRSPVGPHTGLGLPVGTYFEPHGGVKPAREPRDGLGSAFYPWPFEISPPCLYFTTIVLLNP